MSAENPSKIKNISRRELFMWLASGGLALTGGGALVLKVAEYLAAEASPFETEATLDLDFSKLADGEPLDPSIWSFVEGNTEANYNNEAQTYTSRPENVRIENGMLVIEARKEQLNGKEYTSARLKTERKMDILYGKIEIEAQLPSGIGTWPAFWLRTTETPFTNGATEAEKADPNYYRKNGELDFMEGQGARPGLIFAHAHTKASADAKDGRNQAQVKAEDSSQAFHRYGIEWTPTYIAFLLDGKEYLRIEKKSNNPDDWPFDHYFNLVINFAMGGDWAMSLKEQLDLPFENGIDDSQAAFWKLFITYIRYWKLKAPKTA